MAQTVAARAASCPFRPAAWRAAALARVGEALGGNDSRPVVCDAACITVSFCQTHAGVEQVITHVYVVGNKERCPHNPMARGAKLHGCTAMLRGHDVFVHKQTTISQSIGYHSCILAAIAAVPAMLSWMPFTCIPLPFHAAAAAAGVHTYCSSMTVTLPKPMETLAVARRKLPFTTCSSVRLQRWAHRCCEQVVAQY